MEMISRRRVVTYARTSTKKPEQDASYVRQAETLRRFVEAKGWKFRGSYSDRKSAKTLNRPGFQAMLQDMAKWDILLVPRLDRAFRDDWDWMEVGEWLERRGKVLVSIYEKESVIDRPPSAVDRFTRGVEVGVAKLDLQVYSQRVIAGMREKARQMPKGILHRIPFGFRKVEGRDEWEPCPIEAPVVVEIFDRYVAGQSFWGIARALNHGNVRTRKGSRWTADGVRYLLGNPAYVGDAVYGDIERRDVRPAIVEVVVFQIAQLLQRARSRARIHSLEGDEEVVSPELFLMPDAGWHFP